MSAVLLSYNLEWNTSGAMYTGVPSKVPVMSSASLETPTSVILTELSSESLNVKERTQTSSMHFYEISFTFLTRRFGIFWEDCESER